MATSTSMPTRNTISRAATGSTKGLSFVAYGLNLTNEVFGFCQGSKQYPIQREFYHPTFAFGMKWTSAPEQ